MSEHDLAKRQVRVVLYMMALLHLACLALFHKPAPDRQLVGSHYAMHSLASPTGPSL
jgi:hypothetical protein